MAPYCSLRTLRPDRPDPKTSPLPVLLSQSSKAPLRKEIKNLFSPENEIAALLLADIITFPPVRSVRHIPLLSGKEISDLSTIKRVSKST